MNHAAVLTLATLSAGIVACNGVNPVVTNVTPTLATTYKIIGTVDAQTATDPSPVCNGTPTPPAPDVNAWWAGIDPNTRNAVVVTGFELWSNTLPGCANARHDVYRGHFRYDLAGIRALDQPGSPVATRINAASFQFTIQAGNADVASSTLRCFATAGGVTAVNLLQPGATLLSGVTQVAPTDDFPATVKRIEQIVPVPATLPATVGPLTITPGGGGLTVVDVEIRNDLIGALNRGDSAIGFSLISVAEARPTVNGDEFLDCKTFVRPGVLKVTSS
jgi:hypothetical protein